MSKPQVYAIVGAGEDYVIPATSKRTKQPKPARNRKSRSATVRQDRRTRAGKGQGAAKSGPDDVVLGPCPFCPGHVVRRGVVVGCDKCGYVWTGNPAETARINSRPDMRPYMEAVHQEIRAAMLAGKGRRSAEMDSLPPEVLEMARRDVVNSSLRSKPLFDALMSRGRITWTETPGANQSFSIADSSAIWVTNETPGASKPTSTRERTEATVQIRVWPRGPGQQWVGEAQAHGWGVNWNLREYAPTESEARAAIVRRVGGLLAEVYKAGTAAEPVKPPPMTATQAAVMEQAERRLHMPIPPASNEPVGVICGLVPRSYDGCYGVVPLSKTTGGGLSLSFPPGTVDNIEHKRLPDGQYETTIRFWPKPADKPPYVDLPDAKPPVLLEAVRNAIREHEDCHGKRPARLTMPAGQRRRLGDGLGWDPLSEFYVYGVLIEPAHDKTPRHPVGAMRRGLNGWEVYLRKGKESAK